MTPFEFPFASVNTPIPHTHRPPWTDIRVTGLPRANRVLPMTTTDKPLMDAGANICITGDINLLLDATPIPPFSLLVATTSTSADNNLCTMKGLIEIPIIDGSPYLQECYYCEHATETIISPEAILAGNDTLTNWTQAGGKDATPGSITFRNEDGSFSFTINLTKVEGLYYCDSQVPRPSCLRVTGPRPQPLARHQKRYHPVSRDHVTESEVWMLRFGSPGEDQLSLLPGRVTGIPPGFQYHPFRFIDWKEEARIQKQAAQKSAERTTEIKRRYYMDFGFMQASTSTYGRPNKAEDRVVQSHDSFSSYLLVIDEASRYAWVFLTDDDKDPPTTIIDEFRTRFGHPDGGSIRTDQGGELARSSSFTETIKGFHYLIEPTGADSPSQNGAVEIYNDKLGVRVRTLLYGSGLPAPYWSSALQTPSIYTIDSCTVSPNEHRWKDFLVSGPT